MKPRIFIGSSNEGLSVAQSVKNYFSQDYDCFIWTDNIFQFNEGFLETLLKSASLFDFGFIIFASDDISRIRGKEFETTRDNVLFEYGLFLGRVGIDRAYVLCEENVKIPTDLAGLTLARYSVSTDKTGNKIPTDSLKITLSLLKKNIDEKVMLGNLGLLPSTVIAISYYENFIKLLSDYFFQNEGSIKIGENTYNNARIRIVVPKDLDADMKKHATRYFRLVKFEMKTIPTVHRSYPIYIATNIDDSNSETVLVADMPTILNGIEKAINLYFRIGHIGKTHEQQLTEYRELNNFVNVLKQLVKEDAYCRDIVEIVNEDNEKL